MSKKIPCEEIQKLKRDNFWLCKDRIKVKNLMREKLDHVVELNKSMQQMEYCYLKDFTKQRNKILDEHSLLIVLYVRINKDIYKNGVKIMKLRDGVNKGISK
ncbi:hypothetical protein Phab24_id040 [Acinetobacter phage Phab24]|nr:hypothetical protein Phab24_id040 [Acinetobacter phage Phab24]